MEEVDSKNFNDFLVEKDVYDAFYNNLFYNGRCNVVQIDDFESLEEFEYISSAFLWLDSYEDSEFWEDINEGWLESLEE